MQTLKLHKDYRRKKASVEAFQGHLVSDLHFQKPDFPLQVTQLILEKNSNGFESFLLSKGGVDLPTSSRFSWKNHSLRLNRLT